MMTIRLIYFGLFLNCFIYYTYAQHAICNSIEGYDTKTLTSPVQWQVTNQDQCLGNRASNCTYYISFCQPAPICFNQYSACQNYTESTNLTIIGAYNPTVFHENESGPKGFYANFSKAPMQNISNTTTCEPSLVIKFNCKLAAIWTVPSIDNATGNAPEPTLIDYDANDTCLTTMTFDYSGACYNGEEPKKEEEKITPGAVFLIILFSVVLVYFIVGMIYNGLVKHRSGIHLIPQAQFWIGLPLNAIEGCRASLSCCSGSPKPSPATYESV